MEATCSTENAGWLSTDNTTLDLRSWNSSFVVYFGVHVCTFMYGFLIVRVLCSFPPLALIRGRCTRWQLSQSYIHCTSLHRDANYFEFFFNTERTETLRISGFVTLSVIRNSKWLGNTMFGNLPQFTERRVFWLFRTPAMVEVSSFQETQQSRCPPPLTWRRKQIRFP
jgi:hypothetical protein